MSSAAGGYSILLSGGSGLLGKALIDLDNSICAPRHSEMDVRDLASIENMLKEKKPDVCIHAAAFTSPPRVDANPQDAVHTNILGTAHMVLACMGAGVRLVYLSTDYVFKGDTGMYSEEDEIYPQNKYAWSKLGGECAVRLYDNSLIIRTSFIGDEFPYEKAFVDQYTSRDSVSVIAKMVLSLAKREDVRGVIHVGTERKAVIDLARRLSKKEVGELHRNEVSFTVPEDTSFDLTKLRSLGL